MKKYLKKVNAFLAGNANRTFKPKELARKLGVPKPQYALFRDGLKKLAAEGRIAKHRGNNFGHLKHSALLEGEVHIKTQGYGFLITPEGEDDVFISHKNMQTAMNGDTVRVQLFAQSRGRSREGKVMEVVKRAHAGIVGTYKKTRRYGFVTPDDLKIPYDIFIHDSDSKQAKPGQKVVVKLLEWEDRRNSPEGEIVEILGFPDQPGVDVISVVKSFDLPTVFPAKVLQATESIDVKIPKTEIDRRLDLRQMTCFTIDPVDAKDFDDAVSIRQLDNGHLELGVHIADVSYYVPENGTIDKEALQRGTSVYLVDRVVPMLPERLSNELCSLRPKEDRLTFSCIMEVTLKGDVAHYRIAETVIHSNCRFAYEEVQKVINDKNLKSKFAKDIRLMYELSKTLIKKRAKLGSLDFDIPEVKVIVDKAGHPVEIKKQERIDSHRLVEEFMLLANRTVTEHIALRKAELQRVPPFIYRIHEEPTQTKMDDFKKFVKALGFPLDPNKKVTGKLLGGYLRSVKGKPEEGLIEGLMLRSLMKAKYSTENAGHFGLAFKNYTHFTSPIRRYPDLAVHRLLKEYATGFDPEQFRSKKSRIDKIAKISSERELVALEAERESIKLKKVEYMQRHLGDEFDGLISGIVPFGIFVQIVDLLVEGLVHISDLEDDYYVHDEKNYRLKGERSGKNYRLGDSVKVRVVRVDKNERIVDFVLVN